MGVARTTITKGNLTEAVSSIFTITGGTDAVIGSGTSIQVAQASAGTNGYLSSGDWSTFNGKQDALTGSISGTANQVSVTANPNSVATNITLSTPQDIATSSSPTFHALTLTETTGTAPLTIASTTLVSNLNVDHWDGEDYPLTNLGDIFVGGAAGTATRLGIGGLNTLLHGGATPSYSAVVEDDISLSNNTTNNVSITKHGFAPILPNNANQFLNGQGNWTIPTGTSDNDYSATNFVGQVSVNVVHNFGAYPIVQIIDALGVVFINYTITHNTVNDFTATFTAASSGTIIASMGSPQPMAYSSINNDYVVLNTDRILNVTAAGKTITLYASAGNAGREIIVDNSSSGNITVVPNGAELIEGETSQVIPPSSAMNIYCTGTAAGWRIY